MFNLKINNNNNHKTINWDKKPHNNNNNINNKIKIKSLFSHKTMQNKKLSV